MIHVTFPDGAKRAYEPGVSGLDIAKSISPSLAKRTVAAVRDGELVDLADPIDSDAPLEFISRDDPRALELIRHDAAHVLAEAVQSLWPGTQVTIGPVIENGFYYDFFRNEPFTPEDFPAIEKRMREIIARDKPFTKTRRLARRGQELLREEGRGVQGRTDRRDSRRSGDQALQPGRVDRPLPRPAHDLDRQDRRRVQADEGRRRLLARRFQPADAVAHLRDRLCEEGGARRAISSSSRRRRSAITASSPAKWTCSISRRRGRARSSGIRRAGPCSRPWSPTCAGAWPPTIRKSMRRRCSTSICGRSPATGAGIARACSCAAPPARRPRPRTSASTR